MQNIFLMPDVMIFFIIGIIGIVVLIILLATESEMDEELLMPIVTGLIIFGIIGGIVSYTTRNILLAILLGGIAWIIISVILHLIKKNLVSDPTDYKIFEGEEATVEIPFSKSKMGNIKVVHSKTGEEMEFPARAYESTDLPYEKGDKVYIKRLSGMIAEVTKSVKWEIKKMKEGGE